MPCQCFYSACKPNQKKRIGEKNVEHFLHYCILFLFSKHQLMIWKLPTCTLFFFFCWENTDMYFILLRLTLIFYCFYFGTLCFNISFLVFYVWFPSHINLVTIFVNNIIIPKPFMDDVSLWITLIGHWTIRLLTKIVNQKAI